MPTVAPLAAGASRRASLLAALATLALGPVALASHAAAQESVDAVWKERELRFSFRSFQAVYPCPVLEHRIARVLHALGARPDLQVSARNCSAVYFEPDLPAGDVATLPRGSARFGTSPLGRAEPLQTADVRVRLSLPAAKTPEVLAELAADRRRRELITEVTGNPLPIFDDPIPFIAERRRVTLSRETAGLEPADCELLDQMVTQVFRDLGVRVVRRGFACDRGHVSRLPPKLEVEALLPAELQVAPGGATQGRKDD